MKWDFIRCAIVKSIVIENFDPPEFTHCSNYHIHQHDNNAIIVSVQFLNILTKISSTNDKILTN